jgi:trans-aconitate 2-methyltransferase
MRPWNPEQYLAHSDLHSKAVRDLVDRISAENPRTVVDLGCGPGNSTEFIAARWPHADITGVDVSREMLEQGSSKHPYWHWILGTIEDFHPDEPFDIVVSCAALHWIPHHDRLLPRLWEFVRSPGVLAIQVPANHKSPLHQAVFQTARSEKWLASTGHSQSELNFRPATEYFSILSSIAQQIDLWETIYYHEMRSLDDLMQWATATVMRPFLDQLSDDMNYQDFVADVRRTCGDAYPTTNRNTILYPEKRLFFVAYKAQRG